MRGDLDDGTITELSALDVLLRRPAWHRDALCREYPHLPWIPETGQRADGCRAVCARCLVRVECLSYALDADPSLQGTWAGTTPVDRLKLRTPRAA